MAKYRKKPVVIEAWQVTKRRLVYWIGLVLGTRFRLWWHRRKSGRWLWGRMRAIQEIPPPPSTSLLDRLSINTIASPHMPEDVAIMFDAAKVERWNDALEAVFRGPPGTEVVNKMIIRNLNESREYISARASKGSDDNERTGVFHESNGRRRPQGDGPRESSQTEAQEPRGLRRG